MKFLKISIVFLSILVTVLACKKKESVIVTTSAIDTLTMNFVSSGGSVTTDGIQVDFRGVCWSTSPSPTNDLITKTQQTGATGNFKSTVYGLAPNTTYYLRAYANTTIGVVYGQQISFTTTAKDNGLVLGQSYAGGIIFYLDNTGEHGLVCAPFDQGSAKWGCDQWMIQGTATSIGSGAQNTSIIVNTCPEEKYSAKVCASLELNFYNDWYLPSKDELTQMYNNLHVKGKGNFSTTYHSSTQYDNNSAWAITFSGGTGASGNLWKGSTTVIRAVRAF